MTRLEVLEALKKLAINIAPRTIITQKDIRTIPKLGFYIYKYFKKLGIALKEAKLPRSHLASSMMVTNEELLDYLKELQLNIDHQLTLWDVTNDKEVYKKYSDDKFSWSIFKKRFNGFKNAIERLKSENGSEEIERQLTASENREFETRIDFNKINFFGRAAEYHVTAELIYRGFQAGGIPIDKGLDLLAVRDNKVFYFQVKHKDLGNNHSIKITKSSFEKRGGGDVYYIFVLLLGDQRKFLIVPFHIFNDWKEDGWLYEEEKAYLLKIKEDNDHFKIISKEGDKELEVTRFIDKWGQIR